jgi:uncharacterized membrane protein
MDDRDTSPKRRPILPLASAVVLLALVSPAGPAGAWLAQEYTLTVLGPPEYLGSTPVATAIDPEGETVVGTLGLNADYPSALQFYPTFEAIGPRFSAAFGVEGDRIVGFIAGIAPPGIPSVYLGTATVWDHRVARSLASLAGSPYPSSMATCVNAAGDIWGAALRRPFIFPPAPGDDALPLEWVSGETLLPLPTLGGPNGAVEACNDTGDSAGWSTTAGGANHCTFWPVAGGVHDCHPAHGTTASVAMDMNNRGQLVANATQYGRSFGYLWQWPGVFWLLPLPGDTESRVQGLNENGDAVGQSCCGATCRAVGWEQQRPVDLLSRTTGAAGWTFGEAVAISNEGAIVVLGTLDGELRNALLTPVDTPVTAWFAWKARIYNWYVQQYVRQGRLLAR